MAAILKRLPPLLALLFAGFAISAAAFHGYYDKWHFRDDDPRFALQGYFDGAAERPFAYRRLIPDLATTIDRQLPASARAALGAAYSARAETSPKVSPVYASRHQLVFYAVAGSIMLLFWAMFALLRTIGTGALPAFAASATALLSMPYIQSVGGYFYDYPEYLLMLLFLIAAIRNRPLPMLAIAALGAWNKESFLLFAPSAFPFLASHMSRRRAAAWLGAAMAVAAMVYQAQRLRFAANPGAPVEFHLVEQLRFFVDPRSLIWHETTYGLPGPASFNLVFLLALAGVAMIGWPGLDRPQRQHAAVAGAINLPIFLLLCAAGEMRNLSFLYPTLLMLIAAGFTRWQADDRARPAQTQSARFPGEKRADSRSVE